MDKHHFFDIIKEDNWKLIGVSANQCKMSIESLDELLRSLPESKTKNKIITQMPQNLNVSERSENKNKIKLV